MVWPRISGKIYITKNLSTKKHWSPRAQRDHGEHLGSFGITMANWGSLKIVDASFVPCKNEFCKIFEAH